MHWLFWSAFCVLVFSFVYLAFVWYFRGLLSVLLVFLYLFYVALYLGVVKR